MARKEDMFGDAGEDIEPVAEQAQEPVAEPAQEPAETPPAEEAPAEPVAAEQPAAPAVDPAPVMVPLAALHETRDEVKALKAQLAALQPPAQPEPAQQPPDMFADPAGWQEYQRQQFSQALFVQRLDMSHRFAKAQHGDDLVGRVVQWADARSETDPYFERQVQSHPDPIGFAVEQYQRDQIASSVTPEAFEQFRAWQAAQQQQQPVASAPAAPIPIPASTPPPTSLVTAPSAGSPSLPRANAEEAKLNAMF